MFIQTSYDASQELVTTCWLLLNISDDVTPYSCSEVRAIELNDSRCVSRNPD